MPDEDKTFDRAIDWLSISSLSDPNNLDSDPIRLIESCITFHSSPNKRGWRCNFEEWTFCINCKRRINPQPWSIQPPPSPSAVSCLDCSLLVGSEVCVTSGRRAKTSRKKPSTSKRETSIRQTTRSWDQCCYLARWVFKWVQFTKKYRGNWAKLFWLSSLFAIDQVKTNSQGRSIWLCMQWRDWSLWRD